MIVVTNTIQVKEGFGKTLAERFTQAKGVQEMPGFVRMEVWLGKDQKGEEVKVSTVWQDEASFKNWTSSESFRQSHRGQGGNEAIVSSALNQYELFISHPLIALSVPK
ncbi:antibiotic biosynthesis monooxygenase [Paenibacillus pini]|uniref:Heme-degrading cytoplasmic oxygenase IsdG n=1 Tax=Paenibacillus pini JCM 16418 TaxID=1236976 RepID=W7YNV8_9BACL|nr:antibiotic biosynthesis monooxygenase [Paenibacillus pini]GAF10117.1 heme-degrading cytoplasmic oxygenase IsdG [Paenibacillus pini JCM 16418]